MVNEPNFEENSEGEDVIVPAESGNPQKDATIREVNENIAKQVSEFENEESYRASDEEDDDFDEDVGDDFDEDFSDEDDEYEEDEDDFGFGDEDEDFDEDEEVQEVSDEGAQAFSVGAPNPNWPEEPRTAADAREAKDDSFTAFNPQGEVAPDPSRGMPPVPRVNEHDSLRDVGLENHEGGVIAFIPGHDGRSFPSRRAAEEAKANGEV